MEYHSIGSLRISVVGLGCNNFGPRLDAAGTERVVHAALDAGITFFDTATTYGGGRSEEYLGRALREHRDKAVIASKAGYPGETPDSNGSARYIRQAAELSRGRLGVATIDLYQLHRPDRGTPIAETLEAFDQLRRAGTIRECGCSNFDADQLREADAARIGTTRFASVQNEFSLLHTEPERGVLGACRSLGIAFIPYFPLASGLLTGKYRKGAPAPPGTRLSDAKRATALTEDRLDTVERLRAYAQDHDRSLLELAFAWLLAHKEVASVIAGAMSPDQVKANAAASEWRLSADQMAEVRRLAAD